MKRRLFWKILIGFWITFILIMEGTWLVFALYGPNEARLERIEQRARAQVAALATAAYYGGGAALEEALKAWPHSDSPASDERSLITFRILKEAPSATGTAAAGGNGNTNSVEAGTSGAGNNATQAGPGGNYTIATDADGNVTATIQSKDNVTYRLVYNLSAIRARLQSPGPLDVPWELVVLGLVGGLVFSACLAWYLTRPIQRLREGFDRLAAGDLATRLGPTMGRRRDEIADLARDFDVMATQLQQLVAAREQLLHDVSHELRSPLARLQVAIGLARQNPQRVTSALERVEAEARRLDELVGEVLTLSRAESGVPQLDDYFDLAGLVQKVVADARFEAQASGVEIAVEDLSVDAVGGQDFDTVIQGNAELIRRALENIVRNALHHSRAGQRVTVTISVDPAAVDLAARDFVISVADQGPGVAAEALDSIFDPFVRAGDAREGQAGFGAGFGLGLAIAKRAVLAHGGRIEARNGTSGPGSDGPRSDGPGSDGPGSDGPGLIVTLRLPVNARPLEIQEPA